MDLEVFNIPLKVLKFDGIWITKRSSPFYIIYSIIMQLLFTYLFTFFLGMYIIYVPDIVDFADQASYFFTYFVCTLKCINIYRQMDKLEKLFQELKECFEEYGINDSFKEPVNQAYALMKVYWGASFGTVFLGGFIPFFTGRLAYRMWFPYDTEIPFYFYLSAIYQWMGTLLYSAANVMMDIIPVLFIANFISMFEHIADRLDHIQKQEEVKGKVIIDNKKELLICIKYQQQVIELVRKIQKMFSRIIFIQGLFSSVILCFVTFALTVVHYPEDTGTIIKFTTYMASMTSQIFIPCFFGTKLRLAYDKIADSLFHCDWMYEDKEFRKTVAFVLENSKASMKIVAFGFVEIDLQNFGTICNSAYSMFSVLRRTR